MRPSSGHYVREHFRWDPLPEAGSQPLARTWGGRCLEASSWPAAAASVLRALGVPQLCSEGPAASGIRWAVLLSLLDRSMSPAAWTRREKVRRSGLRAPSAQGWGRGGCRRAGLVRSGRCFAWCEVGSSAAVQCPQRRSRGSSVGLHSAALRCALGFMPEPPVGVKVVFFVATSCGKWGQKVQPCLPRPPGVASPDAVFARPPTRPPRAPRLRGRARSRWRAWASALPSRRGVGLLARNRGLRCSRVAVRALCARRCPHVGVSHAALPVFQRVGAPQARDAPCSAQVRPRPRASGWKRLFPFGSDFLLELFLRRPVRFTTVVASKGRGDSGPGGLSYAASFT